MHLVSFERRPGPRPSPGAIEPDDRGGATADFEHLEYESPVARRLGALLPPGAHAGDVVDLNRALATRLDLEDAGAPEAEADSLLPADMLAFLGRGALSLAEARRSLAWTCDALARFDAPDLLRAGVVIPQREVRLLSPIPRPGKIVAIARNYMAHATERGQRSAPEEPALFLKASSCVIGTGDEIPLPAASRQVDYEGELAAVIGSVAREVSVAQALTAVAGYCVANDVSARDFQNVRGQSTIGKSCDGFAPLGPSLVTADEVPDPQGLELRTVVSGELRQHANTKEMIFPVAKIIAFASRLMTLEPGDVILTGTPSGVGAAADPPRWLRDGDVVDVEISGLGRLRNYVRGATGV